MADKTSSGRTKNVSCPHCAQMFYSIHTLNVHIAYKHPGERTVTKAPTKRLEPYKKPKAKPRPAAQQQEVDNDEEEDDDPY